MPWGSLITLLILTMVIFSGCSSIGPAAQPSSPTTEVSPGDPSAPGTLAWWRLQTRDLPGVKALANDVYTITIARDDLWVQSEMGDIPISAGIASKFYFYRCTCGLGKVIGEFIVTDYEANQVVDALRAGGFTVAGMSPILMTERPRMMSVRFQSEATMDHLVTILNNALRWTGPQRGTTRPAE